MIAWCFAVFGASLVGSLHCAGMCGGFVACLCGGPSKVGSAHLAYHAGRGVGYLTLGALAGLLGATLQDSIALIHQACKAPPLSPPEYRAIFTLLANELGTNQMQGHQTIDNVRGLAEELGIDAKKEDIRFIIDVVGKQDPWFEQGASALVFASRFRNFVIGQCQDAGMQLSTDEIDLIDAWFAGGSVTDQSDAQKTGHAPPAAAAQAESTTAAGLPLGERTARWWQETAGSRGDDDLGGITGDNDRADEFPRIVRNRLKA